MAQAYITSNLNDYRRYYQKREPPIIPDDVKFDCDENEDFWKVTKTRKAEDGSDLAKGEAILQLMRMRRMVSTYRRHYCKETSKQEPSELRMSPLKPVEGVGFEDALLENCKVVFGKRTKKLLPPLGTTRRVNGYMRTSRFYTPLTVYQRVHGKVAYKILEDHHQRIHQHQ